MAEHDPKQAIAEYVSLPLGVVRPNPPLPIPALGQRRQGELRCGGGLGALEGTIHFFQERRLPDRQLHEITFEDEAGQQQHWLCSVIQNQQGDWRVGGGANVSDAKHAPVRDHPWANLAGGGWNDQFWAGGRVLDNGLDVVRVRLISKMGRSWMTRFRMAWSCSSPIRRSKCQSR